MTERSDSYTGRLGEAWRVRLQKIPPGWTGFLFSRLGSSVPEVREMLGTFSTLSEAMAGSEKAARRIVKEKMGEDPGQVREWRPAYTISGDRSKVASRLLELEELSKTQSRFTKISSVLPIFVGVIAGTAALIVTFATRTPNFYHQKLESRIADVERTAQLSKAELNSTESKLAALIKVQSSSPSNFKVDDALVSLRTDAAALKARLDSYEVALGDDPGRRLAVAMLRKDLDTIRDEHKADLSAIHEEMSRTFDLMKWLLGLVGAGSLASGLSAFLGKIRAPRAQESES